MVSRIIKISSGKTVNRRSQLALIWTDCPQYLNAKSVNYLVQAWCKENKHTNIMYQKCDADIVLLSITQYRLISCIQLNDLILSSDLFTVTVGTY